MSLQISLVGGDERQYYMLLHLLEKLQEKDRKVQVKHYLTSFPTHASQTLSTRFPDTVTSISTIHQALEDCRILIGPVPFSRDGIHLFTPHSENSLPLAELENMTHKLDFLAGGNIPKYVKQQMPTVSFLDFMKEEEFLDVNSRLSAEGLLSYIINHTKGCIENSSCLVTGYGRFGSAIAAKLSSLGSQVFVYDRKPEKNPIILEAGYQCFDIRSYPTPKQDFDFVINTIPAPVIKAPFLRTLRKDCVLFETASLPGGFDSDICQGLALKRISCPGIPGKTAPKAAGIAMAESIITHL